MLATEMLGRVRSMQDPALDAFPVTPHDTNDLAVPARALLIGTAGNLKVITVGGSTITLVGVPAGLLPLAVTRVYATLTTAANISGLV